MFACVELSVLFRFYLHSLFGNCPVLNISITTPTFLRQCTKRFYVLYARVTSSLVYHNCVYRNAHLIFSPPISVLFSRLCTQLCNSRLFLSPTSYQIYPRIPIFWANKIFGKFNKSTHWIWKEGETVLF